MDSQNLNFLILRGVSGSGKTTLGAKLVGETGVLLSVEDYFTERRMKFDPKKLPDARKWNYDRTFISFDARISPIVLDDTNLIAWPLRHYAQKAIDCGYTIAIHEPDTPWKKDASVCAQKNIHNATEDAIKKMLEGYQEYTVDEILTSEQPLKRSFTPSVYEPKNTGLKLYILRGIAGSGKSTLAKTLAGDEGLILSTDDFFNVNGTYQFDAKKLSEAHKWNQERAIAALEAHKNPIIIDNTNLQPWEPKIYVTKGIENGYDVDIVEPDTPWKRDVNELAKKNTHGVDAQGIAKMLERMVNYTVTDVLNAQLPDFNKRNVNTPKKVAVTADIQERMQKMKLQENSEKVLYVLRGISGSGKSTLSKKLIGDTGVVFSTDDYFMVNGAYQFDVKKLGEAHKWNQERASAAIESGRSPIVIDNTNLQAWEPKAYVVKAVDCGYSVKVVEPDTPWKRDANELAKRNTHGVNAEVIGKMLDRMENYTVEDILVAQQPEWKKPTPVVTTPKKSEREPVIVTKDGFTVINTNTKRKPATGPKSPVVTPKKDNKEASTKSFGNSFALLSDE